MERDLKTIHFIYALPNQNYSRIELKIDNFLKKFNTRLYRNWHKKLLWGSPVRAPISITYNILKELKKHFKVKLYDIDENLTLKLSSNDIILGHPWPDHKTKLDGKNSWINYDKNQITNATILNIRNEEIKSYLISPLNTDPNQINWIKPLVERCYEYIGIFGDVWLENLNQNQFKNIKLHHLNMAIDVKDYPFLKENFNKKFKRKFLYIGRNSEEKGVKMLENLAERCPEFNCGYISNGVIKNCNKISDICELSPSLISKLSRDYDYFISPSLFDAQATTILESMAWGFAIVATDESGYDHPSIFKLDKFNLEFNINLIKSLQIIDEEILLDYQRQNLLLLESKYNWETFTNKLIKILK